MLSGRNLSKRKTATQNISISPYLKDWINRYVKSEAKKNPKDQRFKSMSAFYNFVMEKVMETFQSGKSLDDLENIVDAKISRFYDSHTFKAFIPLIEQAVDLNKYNFDNLDFLMDSYQKYREFIIKESNLKESDLLNLAKRFQSFLIKNNLVSKFNVKFEDGKFIVEYNGHYRNIHYEQTKSLVIGASIMGLKLINSDIFEGLEEKEAKMIFEPTPLFTTKDINKKDMRNLVHENMEKFINYYNMINDKVKHLWIYLSKNKDIIVNFKNEVSALEWIYSFIDNLRKFATRKDLKLSILKLFEHFHWITIKDEQKLTFGYELPDSNLKERSIIDKILKGIGNLERRDETFYLK